MSFDSVAGNANSADPMRQVDGALVLSIKQLVLVGDDRLFLKEIIIGVFDIRVVACSAAIDRDICPILGDAKQTRQKGLDAVIVIVDSEVIELGNGNIAPSPHHRCTAAAMARSWRRFGYEHLLAFELIDDSEPSDAVSDNALRNVEGRATHAVFYDFRKRRLAGGRTASNNVKSLYVEGEVSSPAIVAVDVDRLDLHGLMPKDV